MCTKVVRVCVCARENKTGLWEMKRKKEREVKVNDGSQLQKCREWLYSFFSLNR